MSATPDYISLFNLNPLPILVYELEHFQFVDVNHAAINHYGYSKEEFLKLTIKDIRPKNEISHLSKFIESIDKFEGNIDVGTISHLKKNGDLIRMKINGHKVEYLDKPCMMVVCQDVTSEEQQLKQLRESEEALRISEMRFRTIFEIASLGIIQVDPSDGQIILVNAYYEVITGYATEELIKMSFVDLTHPDDRENDWEIFSKALKGELEYRNEKRYIRKDGSIVWVRVHLAFIHDENGKPIRTVAICEDISIRKKEEQRLQLLEKVITNTSDAVIITEADPIDHPGPRIIYVNDAFTEMTGYTNEEVIGKSPRFLQGPKSDKAELERLKRSMLKGESCEVTTINYKKNGEEFWINFTVTPVSKEEGGYTHFIAIERDVTEHKERELGKELLGKISYCFSSEIVFIDALNKLCKTISQYDDYDFVELWLPNAEKTEINLITYVAASQSAENFYEWSEEITSFKIRKGLPGKVWDQKKSLIWSEINKNDEFIRKNAAGKSGIKTALGLPLHFNDQFVGALVIGTQKGRSYLQRNLALFNQLEGYIGSEINRKKIDLDLRQANERFEKVTEATSDAIWDWNIMDDTLYWGKGFEELFGYQVEKNTPTLKSWLEHIHPEDRDRVIKSVHALLGFGNETNWLAEYRYEKVDGKFAAVIDRGVIIRDEEGKAIRMVGAMNDISERKNFEQQLLKLNESLKKHARELELTNEELEQFAFIASHDLQEPLRMISSFLDQLKRKYDDQLDDKAMRYIHFATDGARRMKQIILDLLEFSRAGKLTDNLEEVDMNVLLSDWQILRKNLIAEKSAQIKIGKLPIVKSYKAALTQTLHSLLDNAIKYSKPNQIPKIEILAQKVEDFWKIQISDNGIGIDAQFYDKIFVIFQRLHNREDYTGNGIGLSIVKKHVEAWGGKIWVDSKVGEGSTFYFTVPKK